MTMTAPQKLAEYANGNPKPQEMQVSAEVTAAHERLAGLDPRDLKPSDFWALGHEKRPLLAVIRENCLQCQGGSVAEVRLCKATGCGFWPYRMRTNPFRIVTDMQRETARTNLRRISEHDDSV